MFSSSTKSSNSKSKKRKSNSKKRSKKKQKRVQIKHLPYKKRDDIVLVPINKIFLQKPMIKALKDAGFTDDDLNGFQIENNGTFSLQRLKQSLEDYENKKDIPANDPIILKEKDNLIYSGFYSIKQGRHRITVSILKGLPYIPAVIE